MVVRYTCTRCGYTTTEKWRFVKHANRKTDCLPARDENWLKEETEKMVEDFKKKIGEFSPKYNDVTNRSGITAMRREYIQINELAGKIKQRIKLIKADEISEKEALETINHCIAELKLFHDEIVSLYHCGDALGVDCGKKAMGSGGAGADSN